MQFVKTPPPSKSVRANTGLGIPRPPHGPINTTTLSPNMPAITSGIGLEGLPMVAASFILLPDIDGGQLQQENLLFVYRMPSRGYEAYNIANLKMMNNMLRDAHTIAHGLLTSKADVKPNLDQSIFHELLTKDELSWPLYEGYKAANENADLRFIVQYMRAEDILKTWSHCGVLLADMSIGRESKPNQYFSALMKGWGYVNDVWGEGLTAGQHLYLILKRVWDPTLNAYSCFQFVPYVLPVHLPTIPPSEMEYEDLAGNKTYGIALYIGMVLDRPGGTTTEEVRLMQAGLVPNDGSMPTSYASVQSLIINLTPKPGKKVRYHM